MKSKLRAVCVGLATAAGLGFSGAASADFQSCIGPNDDTTATYDISGSPYVTTATNCQILKPLNGNQNDSPQPGFVNGLSPGFFDITDWLFDGKWDSTDDGFVDDSDLFDFTFPTGGDPASSGSYTFVGTPTPGSFFSEIMFVFKDGANTNLVGYLVTQADGSYQNMFVNPPFNVSGTGIGDRVSHISVYYREREQQTPEPASLALLGLGLAGLAAVRRRRPR